MALDDTGTFVKKHIFCFFTLLLNSSYLESAVRRQVRGPGWRGESDGGREGAKVMAEERERE